MKPHLNKLSSVSAFILIAGFILLVEMPAWTVPAIASSITWTGSNVTGLWSDPANWSGGTQPVAGASAIFDGTSVVPCLIDVNPGGVTLQIAATYAGAITQARTLRLRNSPEPGQIHPGRISADAGGQSDVQRGATASRP